MSSPVLYPPPSTVDSDTSTCDICNARADTEETVSGTQICDTCAWSEGYYYTCDECELLILLTEALVTTVDGAAICRVCASGLRECDRCDRLAAELRTTTDGIDICDYCYRGYFWTCDGCLDVIRDGDYCESCSSSDEDDDCDCEQCSPYGNQRSQSYEIHPYTYKPSADFHGEGPTYFGLELEIETRRNSRDDCVDIAAGALGDVGYLKRDCTIDYGFEIVTHPMSHEWLASSFPWGMLDALNGAGASAQDTTGMHVHVSRAAFDNPSHVYRWLKLLYRNEGDVTAIARRSSDQWAPFKNGDRQSAKEYAKGERYADRYAAVNVTNYATFELRIFASSLRRQEVRAALDLASASVEYTRTLTVADIVSRGGWDWSAFSSYVNDSPQYAALAAEIGALCAS